MAYNNRTTLTVAPRKPLNLNQSVKSPNNLMCGSLNGQPIAEDNYHSVIGDNYDETRYYCGSAGHVSQEAVKRYINEQEGKDVFEYSIFGDPTGQTKIGDFSC